MRQNGRPEAGGSRSASFPGAGWLVAIVLAAALFRGVEAARKSYWLDELHTLHVAEGGTASDVIARVKPDFHAPIFFLGVHALEGLPPHALRVLPVVLSLLTLLPLLALARAGGLGRRGAVLAGVAFAALPFQVQYGAELRPYSGLGLAAATLAWAAFAPAPRPGRRTLVFALASALGLLTHYVAAAAILGVGAARLVVRPPGALPFGRLLLGGTLGVALFLPWVVYDESWIFEDPGLITRNEDVAGTPDPGLGQLVAAAFPELRGDLLSIVPRMAVPSIGGLGAEAGPWALRGAALLGGALVLGIVLVLLRGGPARAAAPRPGTGDVVAGALVSALAAFLVVLAACVVLWQRIPLQYFAVAAWSLPLFAGVVADRLPGSVSGNALAFLMAAGSAVAGAAHAGGTPREDLAGAVDAARREAEARGGIATAVLWQPETYAQCTLFRAYAPGFSCVEPSAIGPSGGPGERPVVVVVRSARAHSSLEEEWKRSDLWGRIPEGRRRIHEIRIDPRIVVYVLGPA